MSEGRPRKVALGMSPRREARLPREPLVGQTVGSRLACVPSQKGALPVRLHMQRYACPDLSALTTCGVNPVPACDPSQNGWLVDSPQRHQAYCLPSSNSTAIGCLPATFGWSDMKLLLSVRTWLLGRVAGESDAPRQCHPPNCSCWS